MYQPISQEIRHNFLSYFIITYDNILFTDPPQIYLSLGSKLQSINIKEGDDVYFECKIDSNPQWKKLSWLKNVCLTP